MKNPDTQTNFEEELFRDPKPEPEPKKEEEAPQIIRCQYCEDSGPCTFCKRGQEVLNERQSKSTPSESTPSKDAPQKPERWGKLRPEK